MSGSQKISWLFWLLVTPEKFYRLNHLCNDFTIYVFDPASYPQDDYLNICGLNHLEALLAHYGERKETPTGPIDPLVNPDAARGGVPDV